MAGKRRGEDTHAWDRTEGETQELVNRARQLELPLRRLLEDAGVARGLAAIARFTSGNFRLAQRLFTQIERILRINQLRSVTKEVVEAAPETLLFGSA